MKRKLFLPLYWLSFVFLSSFLLLWTDYSLMWTPDRSSWRPGAHWHWLTADTTNSTPWTSWSPRRAPFSITTPWRLEQLLLLWKGIGPLGAWIIGLHFSQWAWMQQMNRSRLGCFKGIKSLFKLIWFEMKVLHLIIIISWFDWILRSAGVLMGK